MSTILLPDPGTDGAGIAFFDAVLPHGRRFDVGTDAPERAESLAYVRATLGIDHLVTLRQVHGNVVHVIDVLESSDNVLEGDGLVTTVRGLGLAIRTADCVPVLFADSAAGVIGAAHAGRAGLEKGVLATTVARMKALGARSITAWVGPHICGLCYEVPEQMAEAFATDWPSARTTTSWGTPAIDLAAATDAQLASLACEVVLANPCTLTSSTLHSHRREGGQAGRQLSVVWLPDRVS